MMTHERAPAMLAALAETATADDIMAALRGLDLDRWQEVTDRIKQINRYEYTGRREDLDDLAPADRAGLIAPATDPDVIRYAGLVLAAIHADMDRGLVPRDVGSFSALHDHRDANVYLITYVGFHPDDCDCTPTPVPKEEPGDQPYLHSGLCACHRDGGSEDRHVARCNAVMDEVGRRLAAEAAQLRAPGWLLVDTVLGRPVLRGLPEAEAARLAEQHNLKDEVARPEGTPRYVAEPAPAPVQARPAGDGRLHALLTGLSELTAGWQAQAGAALARANRLGNCAAGLDAAGEAGTLRRCAEQLSAAVNIALTGART